MGEALLQLNDVTKRIGAREIIQSASLELHKGQVLALCGGNGAGKSTLLRMIAGILQPTGGDIVVNGYRWKQNRKACAEQIGYMPDDYLFGQGLSAEETLSFWASLRKVSKPRVQETLRLVGLYDVRFKSVSSFSKGMRQRLLFAQALLAEPPLLILDEPTNGLDPYWMESFVELVRRARRNGHAVIFSTHQLPAAEATADCVVFLKEGRMAEQGTIASFADRFGPDGLQGAFQALFGFRAEGGKGRGDH